MRIVTSNTDMFWDQTVLGSNSFVIKIATGFPNNTALGLETGNGLVLSAKTGAVQAIFHDEMRLTDIRTGLGGAVATRMLVRKDARRVLVIGTGPQARCQIEAHAMLLGSDVTFEVWGRSVERAEGVVADLANIAVSVAPVLEQTVRDADVIVTTTGATAPLVWADWVQAGTHITAVGADAPGKQELDVALVGKAEVIAVDSIAQCVDHGEVCHAVSQGVVKQDALTEIGSVLDDPSLGRHTDAQITLADLTSIAAQDIAIAQSVLDAWKAANP